MLHRIDTTTDKPVRRKPINQGPVKEAAKEQLIRSLVEMKAIEPCYGEWSTAIFVVPKRDGTYRLVQDFRPLDTITQRDIHPSPVINELLYKAANKRFYSTF